MKLVVLTLIAIFCLAGVKAQKKSELDWQEFIKSTRETEIANPVGVGEFTIFQIVNINKFLYKVEIEGKVFELQTPIPTELQALFRLSAADLEKKSTPKKAEEAVENIAGAIAPMKEVADEAKEQKTAQQQSIDKLTKKAGAVISDKEEAEIRKAVENKAAFAKLETAATTLVLECEQYLGLAKKVANDLFSLKSARNKFISFAQMDCSGSRMEELVQTVTWPIPDIQTNYIELRERYEHLEMKYTELAGKGKAAKLGEAWQGQIEASLEKIEKAHELIEEEALLGLLNDVDFLFHELTNANNFKVVSPPVQMDGDMVSYDVTITPTATRSLGAFRNPMNFKFNVPTVGGLKVDFSVGPVISFGGKARDDKFFLEETLNADVVKLMRRPNNNTIVPSLAAMMHFYRRGSQWGGMMGVGAGFQSASELNANIFAGLSYIMGKRQKLMASGGVSFLRVDRLKDLEYKEGQEYNSSKIVLSDVVEKVFKPSAFLSLSYNLTNKVEIN